MKFTWFHGLMIALGCFMVFILCLIIFAGHTGELVRDDYYEKDISYQSDIDAYKRTNKLENTPKIIEQANGFLIKMPNQIESGEALFLRSDNSENDITIPLSLNNKNEVLIPEVDLKKGPYEVTLTWKKNQQLYKFKESVTWKMP